MIEHILLKRNHSEEDVRPRCGFTGAARLTWLYKRLWIRTEPTCEVCILLHWTDPSKTAGYES